MTKIILYLYKPEVYLIVILRSFTYKVPDFIIKDYFMQARLITCLYCHNLRYFIKYLVYKGNRTLGGPITNGTASECLVANQN